MRSVDASKCVCGDGGAYPRAHPRQARSLAGFGRGNRKGKRERAGDWREKGNGAEKEREGKGEGGK